MSNKSISAATAVWIATATLHGKYGMNKEFEACDIIKETKKQNLAEVEEITIALHVYKHCVANVAKSGWQPFRLLYYTPTGSYRLYRSGDDYHPTRESGDITPKRKNLPPGYDELLDWYNSKYFSYK